MPGEVEAVDVQAVRSEVLDEAGRHGAQHGGLAAAAGAEDQHVLVVLEVEGDDALGLLRREVGEAQHRGLLVELRHPGRELGPGEDAGHRGQPRHVRRAPSGPAA